MIKIEQLQAVASGFDLRKISLFLAHCAMSAAAILFLVFLFLFNDKDLVFIGTEMVVAPARFSEMMIGIYQITVSLTGLFYILIRRW
jgi:hypothetical protein